VLPIAQSTTYAYDTAQGVADLFDLKVPGRMYSRISNPTVEAFENKMAALEGGVAALATAPGQTASAFAIMNIAASGQHLVAAAKLYGGTFNLFPAWGLIPPPGSYFPKGTDLSAFTQADLNRVALRLNQRPRKTLDFRCPADVFDETVALTG
jgi:hypothetical protein